MRLKFLIAIALAGVALAQAAQGAELLMFRRAGCSWCAAFDRDVGPAYPKSDLGAKAPMRSIDLDRDPRPEVELMRPVRYTPTFVLVSGGREVGRIEGYPGDHFFWARLEQLVKELRARR